MASIPFAKLGALTIKTLAKPISKRVQAYAAESIKFKNICIGVGNTNNKISYYLRNITNGKHKTKYHPVSDKVAIETGSSLIGEGFVYIIGAALIVEEITRSKIAKVQDEQKLEERLYIIETKLDELSKK